MFQLLWCPTLKAKTSFVIQITFSWENITIAVPGTGGGRKCFGLKKSEVRPEKMILNNGEDETLKQIGDCIGWVWWLARLALNQGAWVTFPSPNFFFQENLNYAAVKSKMWGKIRV